MTTPEMTSDYDPSAPFVAQDLLEYPDLGAYFRGEPYSSTRNSNVRSYKTHRPSWATAYAEGFDACAGGRYNIGPSPLFVECHEAGITAGKLRQAERAGVDSASIQR